MTMTCKFCDSEMEDYGSQGISYGEVHYYQCSCGAHLTIHENGEENDWDEPDPTICAECGFPFWDMSPDEIVIHKNRHLAGLDVLEV